MDYNVFLAHTPLHVLYTYHLLHTQEDGIPALICLSHDFEAAPVLAARLRQHLPQRHRVMLLPGIHARPDWGPFTKLTNHLPLLAALQRTRAALRAIRVRSVFVFNDTRPEVQAIMALAKHRSGASLQYVEDGVAAYITHADSPLRARVAWLQRVLYTSDFYPSVTHGMHPLLDGAILTFPDLAHTGLKRLPLAPIPPVDPAAPHIWKLFDIFGFSWTMNTGDRPAALVCLVPFARLTQDFRALLERVIADCRRVGLRVLVKQHPRDEASPPDLGEDVIFIDKGVPAELVCLRLGRQLRRLYAEYSTILLTSGWLIPGIERLYLDYQPMPPARLALLEKAGIQRIR
jgi:hypothetical protein